MKRIRLLSSVAASGLAVSMLCLASVSASASPAATVTRTAIAHTVVTNTPEVPAAASACPSGAVCGWTGANYSGTIGILYDNNTTLPAIPWHEIDSVWNNGTPCTTVAGNVWIYYGTDYNSDGGHVAEIHPGTGFNNMAAQLPGLHDHVYSNHWCTAG